MKSLSVRVNFGRLRTMGIMGNVIVVNTLREPWKFPGQLWISYNTKIITISAIRVKRKSK